MIEVIDPERCTACNICVNVCPTNVFGKTDGIPIIARQSDCQTCFLCELYCPFDALYVSPLSVSREPVSEKDLIARGLLGSFRREMGWKSAKPRGTHLDLTYRMFEDGIVCP